MHKRILFLIPTLEGGGAEKVLVNLVNSITESTDWEVEILLLVRGGDNQYLLNKSVRTSSIFPVKIPLLRIIFKLFSPSLLYRLFIRNQYDLIIAFLEGTMMRIVSGAPDGQKTIGWFHSSITAADIKQHYRSLSEFCSSCESFNRIVAVSDGVRSIVSDLSHISIEKILVLPNVNDDRAILKMSKIPTGVLGDLTGKTAVVVGKLARSKGVFRVLDALKSKRKELEDLTVAFVGTGPDADELEREAKLLGLSERIIFAGYQDNPYNWIKESSFLICPSYAEGLSTVVTEALLLGRPVVATRCSGMEELLGESEFGLIVDNQTDALLEGICKMCSDDALREKYANASYVRGSLFSKTAVLEKILSNIEELWQEVIEE